MSSIFTDPSIFKSPGDTSGERQLIVNGRYVLPPIGDATGKPRSLQRVTNFIKQISDTAGLEKWKLRSAIIGLASREDLYDLTCSIDPNHERGMYEIDKIVERCIDAAKAYRPSGGNETGTALHNYTDNVGHSPIRVREKWAPKVENYRRALHEQGLRAVPGLSERLVVSERYGTCGRLDDIYEDPFGAKRVGDRKSQKEFQTWFEIAAQLALYNDSDAMWNEQTHDWEAMPRLAGDYGIVAWMPVTAPGADPNAVVLYELPLDPARELLREIALVRDLRRGARSWGKAMPSLDDFARTARDIRDAESHDDLRKIHAERAGVLNAELLAMAGRRWEELAAAPEPPLVPYAVANRGTVSLADLGIAANGSGVAQHLSDDPTTRALQYAAADAVAPAASIRVELRNDHAFGSDQAQLVVTGPKEDLAQITEDWRRFAALFESPDASFPDSDGAGVAELPAQGAVAGAVAESAEILRTPVEWLHHLGLDISIPADPEDTWRRPMTQEQFKFCYQQGHGVVPAQAHPVATTPYTHSKHAGATVVELPDLLTPDHWAAELGITVLQPAGWRGANGRDWGTPISREEFIERARASVCQGNVLTLHEPDQGAAPTLDSVPVKIVREVATRAANSASSRGRVRLLNDLEKKYEAHKQALLPALLAEWLAIDGGPVAGETYIDNTAGAKRKPMEASDAGPVTLSQYLASKGEGGPALDEVAQVVAEVNVTANDKALERLADQEIRRQYEGIEPDKHSVLRLVELATEAANGAERAKVFHEITRRGAWTGAIAEEINAAYRRRAVPEVDFSGYFQATALPDTTVVETPFSPLEHGQGVTIDQLDTMMTNGHKPDWIDGPNWLQTSPDEAIQMLNSCMKLSELHTRWEQLAKLPCWSDPRVQETAFALLGKLKA